MSIDASDLHRIGHDLGNTGARLGSVLLDVFRDAGVDLRDQWKTNARATSGTHGKLYPEAITMDMRIGLDIEVEVGPDPGKPQGEMSFEFGSSKQEPHLDGQRAAEVVEPRLERRIDTALSGIGL